MAISEILPFAFGAGANIEDQAAYAADPLRTSGNVAGIAKSTLNNKALLQSTLIASAVAKFIADNQANNITDQNTFTDIANWLKSAVQSLSAIDYLNTTRIDVASAATVNLTSSAPNTRSINITGTTSITAFTVAAGQLYFVRFAGVLTLTNNAGIVTQRGANITTAAGDTCVLQATAANVVEVLCYTPGAVTGTGSSVLSTSPALSGTPTAPTAAAGTNTTQLATTAFVTAADNLKAPLASPAFTDTPAAPTAAAGTNTTQLATTAFVQSQKTTSPTDATSGRVWRTDDLVKTASTSDRTTGSVVKNGDKQVCTAWVNFNGTGTVAIRDSFNVSSITDNGVGHYTINFSTAMNNANYSVVVGYGPNNGSSAEGVVIGTNGAATDIPPTTSGFTIVNFVSGATPFDITRLMLQVFGGK